MSSDVKSTLLPFEEESLGWFPSAAALCCDVFLLWTLFLMVTMVGDDPLGLPSALVWAGALLAAWTLFRAFAAKPRTIPVLIGAGALAAGGQLAAVLLWGPSLTGGARLILAVAALLAAAHGGWLVFHPIRPSQTNLYLDAGALFLIYLLVIQNTWGASPEQLLPVFLVVVLSFLSLVCQRLSGGRRQVGGGGLLGAVSILWVLLVVGGLAIAFLLLFSESAGQGLVVFLSFVMKVIETVWQGFVSVLTFLLSLLPQAAPDGDLSSIWDVPQAGMPEEVPQEVYDLPDIVGYLVWGTFGALLVLAALRWLWQMRRVRISGRTAPPAPKIKRSRGHFLRGLAQALGRLGRALALTWRSFRLRNTPAGALAWLERRGRLHGLSRRKGETFRQYLERLAKAASGQEKPETAAALLYLAGWLELSCYSGTQPPAPPSPEKLRDLRRSMKQVMRGHQARSLGQLLERLPRPGDLLPRRTDSGREGNPPQGS